MTDFFGDFYAGFFDTFFVSSGSIEVTYILVNASYSTLRAY